MEHGEPHWLSGAGPQFPPPDALSASAEALVVGGGLMGVATAYWLARAGASVMLLERCGVACGASGRNAGLALHNSRQIEDPVLVETVLAGEEINAGYEKAGHLALASALEVWDRVRAEVTRRPAHAPPLHALDRAECESLLGMRVDRRFLGGRWLPDGRVVDPVRLVRGLAVAARRRGAVIACDTEVVGVERGKVESTRGTVRAEHVVFACGADVARFVPGVPLRSVRGRVLATAPLPRLFQHGMAQDWGTVYWRQDHDGTVVLGGVGATERFLGEAFPDLPEVMVTRRWEGVMDYSPDDQPLVGALSHVEGQWIIAGFGGHGLPGGIGAGRALAEHILSGRPAPALSAFSPDRFPQGR